MGWLIFLKYPLKQHKQIIKVILSNKNILKEDIVVPSVIDEKYTFNHLEVSVLNQ